MKLSDLMFGVNCAKGDKVETDTDSLRIIVRENDVQDLILVYGDQEIVWDGEWNTFRVPALDAKRTVYNTAKQAWCSVNTCE